MKCLKVNNSELMQVVSGVEGTTNLTTVVDETPTEDALARPHSVWDSWHDAADE